MRAINSGGYNSRDDPHVDPRPRDRLFAFVLVLPVAPKEVWRKRWLRGYGAAPDRAGTGEGIGADRGAPWALRAVLRGGSGIVSGGTRGGDVRLKHPEIALLLDCAMRCITL